MREQPPMPIERALGNTFATPSVDTGLTRDEADVVALPSKGA